MYFYLILLLFLLSVLKYFYNGNHYSKWRKLNVPGPEPIFFFGNMRKVATLQASISGVYDEIYKKFTDCKYVGIYIMNRPAVLVRDPEIVEEVLVKSFANFHDNDLDVDPETDPIFGDNPFTSRGESWKTKRIQHLSGVTPAKVKAMFAEVEECGARMVAYINRQIDRDGRKCCIEALELAARYTTESVTAVGLGITSESFTDAKPELREAGKAIFEPSASGSIKIFFLFILPKLAQLISLRMIPLSLYNKYKNLVAQTLKYRTENNIRKNDFFEHLQEFRGKKMSVEDMTAQLGGLYADGFGTNSSALNFMIYLLAANEDVQVRLRNEIREYLGMNGGVLTFDLIQEMGYLEAVMSESLRQYPPFPNLSKRCTKTCTLPRASAEASELTIEEGTPIIVPAYSIHNDRKYFQNPEKFDPDRFLGGNRESIQKYSYIPFGEGPRICLGMRFGILQSKLALVKLLLNFKLSVNHNKTKAPIKLHPYGLVLAAKDGLWIHFEKL